MPASTRSYTVDLASQLQCSHAFRATWHTVSHGCFEVCKVGGCFVSQSLWGKMLQLGLGCLPPLNPSSCFLPPSSAQAHQHGCSLVEEWADDCANRAWSPPASSCPPTPDPVLVWLACKLQPPLARIQKLSGLRCKVWVQYNLFGLLFSVCNVHPHQLCLMNQCI